MTLTFEDRIKISEAPYVFKMTELGMRPGDWQVVPFGSIATLRKTKINPRVTGEKKIFCVELEHISQGTGVLVGNTFTSSKSSIKNHFLQGDILFGKLRAYLRKYWLAIRNGVASTEIWPIIPNLNRSLSEYIFLIVQTDRFIEAASLAYGTHMPRSDWNVIATLKISLPPLPQQRAIAAALSDIDSLINSLDQLIAKKRNIKLAAMQQLLTGKERLPGFSGEWHAIQLGVFGQCLRGVSYKGETDLSLTDNDHTIRLFRSNNIQNSKIIKSNLQYVTSVKVSDHQVMRNNDILICMANGSKELVGKAGLLIIKDVYRYTFGAFMGCFRTNTGKADPRFVFYLLQSNHYRNNISNLLAGSSINNLKPSDIESIEFFTPSLHEQDAIANVLSDMDADIFALEQQLDKARNLKQGMMQELLTGRIRLT